MMLSALNVESDFKKCSEMTDEVFASLSESMSICRTVMFYCFPELIKKKAYFKFSV